VIDDNFATELITELTKAFLRAEDRNTQVRKLLVIYLIFQHVMHLHVICAYIWRPPWWVL